MVVHTKYIGLWGQEAAFQRAVAVQQMTVEWVEYPIVEYFALTPCWLSIGNAKIKQGYKKA